MAVDGMASLRTARLLLRGWHEDDQEALFRLHADPGVAEWLGGALTREQAAAMLDAMRAGAARGWGVRAVCRHDGTFIGAVGLQPVKPGMPFAGVEATWRLASHAWGQGYATEAMQAVLQHDHAHLDGADVITFTAATNRRSQAVMARLGFVHEPARDFDHPALAADHPLRRHVFHRWQPAETPAISGTLQPLDEWGLNLGAWPGVADGAGLTPPGQLFLRSHAPTPPIDADTWTVEIAGLVRHPRRYTVRELMEAFAPREVTATLVCAGLRRTELLAVAPIPGELGWSSEAIGTGRWGGIVLADLLAAAEVMPGAAHVEFLGTDRVTREGREFGFATSISLAKAQSPEVLLATHLAGEPLPPDHGAPLRALVPGWISAKSVKWLSRIEVRATPSDNYFQREAYRLQRTADPERPRSVRAGRAIEQFPLNAVITAPTAGQVLPAGPVRVRGWAIGEGGAVLARIEVSADGGHHWVEARRKPAPGPWAWTCWDAVLWVPAGAAEFVVRAFDASGHVQPEHPAATWNVKGYCNNAWHRVPALAVAAP